MLVFKCAMNAEIALVCNEFNDYGLEASQCSIHLYKPRVETILGWTLFQLTRRLKLHPIVFSVFKCCFGIMLFQ